MSTAVKKKKCFLCKLGTAQIRRFPPPSKPAHQREWLLRLNRDAEATDKLLREHQSATEPRWCLDHFPPSSTDDLPIDHRPIPVRSLVLPTVALRTTRPADLVPPSGLATRSPSPAIYRGPSSQAGTPSFSHMGSIRSPPWSSALARVASNDTFNDEVNDILPKKFKSMVSTRTEATMESMSSGYHYSQEILDGEEGEEEIVDQEDESSAERGRYAIVEDSCLSRLFKRCQECGELLDHSLTERRRCGSALVVITECLACNKKVQWDSQEKVGIGRGQAYSLNHRIPISAFITGTPLPRLCDFARTLDLDFPSDRSMRKTIREIGSVAIERVYAGWEETVREVAVNASEGDGLQVSIDGQYDSPGFTSSNCKVTTIDCHTKLAISGVALSKKEDGIDGMSIRMESEGALRALVDLVNHNIPIKKLVSDQNAMVMKKLREHPKTAHIERKLDWWHVQKHMRKEWWKVRVESE
ncbi:hypothetical protein PENTCL1PPCAC_4007 [Pristionchus entomophagus]|uniref:Mutator-like transposase domain-containing protein n=2 Tax=Pristionchus entomophagus TaxID=358040 RepID=A0AAV5SGM9_9BILA|nr:hypothetical protein PENTCL1PPCAC_4007 [Pristionchus entomophagus]